MSTPYSKRSFSDPDICVVGETLIGKGQSIKGSEDYKLKLDAVCGIKDETIKQRDKIRRRLEMYEFKPRFEEGDAITGSWITVKNSVKKDQEKVAMHSAQHNAQQARFEAQDGEARGHIISHSRIDKEAIPDNIARVNEVPDDLENVYFAIKFSQEDIEPGRIYSEVERMADIEDEKWFPNSFVLKVRIDEDKKDEFLAKLTDLCEEDIIFEEIDG